MLSVAVASAWTYVGWVHSILEVLCTAHLFNTSLVSCAASDLAVVHLTDSAQLRVIRVLSGRSLHMESVTS